MEHKHGKCKWCGRVLIGLVAACVWCAAANNAMGFGGVVASDKAVNDFSADGMNFVFSTITGTAAISQGDLGIDFAQIQKIVHPEPFFGDQKPFISE